MLCNIDLIDYLLLNCRHILSVATLPVPGSKVKTKRKLTCPIPTIYSTERNRKFYKIQYDLVRSDHYVSVGELITLCRDNKISPGGNLSNMILFYDLLSILGASASAAAASTSTSASANKRSFP